MTIQWDLILPDEELRKMYATTSQLEMAEKLGVSVTALRRYLRKLGVRMRRRGENLVYRPGGRK